MRARAERCVQRVLLELSYREASSRPILTNHISCVPRYGRVRCVLYMCSTLAAQAVNHSRNWHLWGNFSPFQAREPEARKGPGYLRNGEA